MSATPEPLFEMGAPRRPKADNPAYRLGRAVAQEFRDERLAELRAHQHECDQCRNAADVAEQQGTKNHEQLCIDGYLKFYAFAVLQVNLMRGYYPDHNPRQPTTRAHRTATPASLFDPEGPS